MEKKIVIHCSFGPRTDNDDRYEHQLLLMFWFLADEHCIEKGKPLIGEWTLVFPDRSTTQQTGGTECGCFTCMFADCLSLGLDVNFDKEHSNIFRQWFILKILEDPKIINF